MEVTAMNVKKKPAGDIILDAIYSEKYDEALADIEKCIDVNINQIKCTHGQSLAGHISNISWRKVDNEKFENFILKLIKLGLKFDKTYQGTPAIQLALRDFSIVCIKRILEGKTKVKGKKNLLIYSLTWRQPKNRLLKLAQLIEEYGYQFEEDISSNLLLHFSDEHLYSNSRDQPIREQFENNESFLDFLIERGADINYFKNRGERMTPLMNAAYQNNYQLVDYLLRKGAYPNALNKKGYTALMFASGQIYMTVSLCPDYDLEAMKLLLENGADPTIKVGNRTALSIAKKSENTLGVKLLESYI